VLLILAGLLAPAFGAETESDIPVTEIQSAPVVIDGTVLFRVRGASSFPAEQRAASVTGRIEAFARDESVPVSELTISEVAEGTAIFAGSRRLIVFVDADAKFEDLDRATLASAAVKVIQREVAAYRQARTPGALRHATVFSGIATLVLAVFIVLLVWLSRRLHTIVEKRFRPKVSSLSIQSFQLVRGERIWIGLHRLVHAGLVIAILGGGFFYLQYVLSLFPGTRGIAVRLLDFVLDPLKSMGQGFLREIPGLIILVLLFLLTRYVLALIHVFFGSLARGEVSFSGFEADWAQPTYKLVRVGVIAFALVVAYPYIPGSGSEAFKVGDRVKIGDTIGDVTEMRVQVTHLRTVKNEEVTIPNSTIVGNEVINYSALAHKTGLILHTMVGIGYETPWRQVEAMLLMAAERTPGLMKSPSPFILQKSLGDFAVNYELNVYCDDAHAMARLYTELHRNILDVFNEYDVQIMTPAYEGDPETPKVVPKDKWFEHPAKPREPLQG
jgi:hypothetical protein